MRIPREPCVRIGTVLVLMWILIGLTAAGQRGYLNGSTASCAKFGTIAVTAVAGPLNYVGANPRVKCTTPRPSK